MNILNPVVIKYIRKKSNELTDFEFMEFLSKILMDLEEELESGVSFKILDDQWRTMCARVEIQEFEDAFVNYIDLQKKGE